MSPWRARRGFVERTIDATIRAADRAAAAEATAEGSGLLQRLDPRVKVVGLISLVVAAMWCRSMSVIAGILALAVVLALLSRVRLASMASCAWLSGIGLAAALAVPALFLTPGRSVGRVPALGWSVTAQGATTAGYLLLRVATATGLGLLLVFTTRWARVLAALRALGVPAPVVVVLGMAQRYVLLLVETARDQFEARRSRTVGRLDGAERRRQVARGAGVLLGRSLDLGNEVFLAMQARGFRGEVRLLDAPRMTRADWAALAALAGMAAVAAWAGR